MRCVKRFKPRLHFFLRTIRPLARCPFTRKRQECGSALLGVLWLVVLIALLASGVITLLRDETAWARDSFDLAQAKGYADAGVFLVIKEMLSSENGHISFVDEESKNIKFQGHDLKVLVRAESGKIDVNYAQIDLIKNLLAVTGLSDAEIIRIGHVLQTYRSNSTDANPTFDNGGRLIQMEKKIYSLSEFGKIIGVSDSIFRRIRPALTVHSQKKTVRAQWAPLVVLRALPGINEEKAMTILAARKTNPQDLANISNLYAQKELNGEVISILVTANVKECTFVRRAVIRVVGAGARPYLILDWGYAEDS